MYDNNWDRKVGKALLKSKIPIYCNKDIKASCSLLNELAVFEASPSSFRHCYDVVIGNRVSEPFWDALIKQDFHAALTFPIACFFNCSRS